MAWFAIVVETLGSVPVYIIPSPEAVQVASAEEMAPFQLQFALIVKISLTVTWNS